MHTACTYIRDQTSETATECGAPNACNIRRSAKATSTSLVQTTLSVSTHSKKSTHRHRVDRAHRPAPHPHPSVQRCGPFFDADEPSSQFPSCGTETAVAFTRPRSSASLFVSLFIAASAMLKVPGPDESIASTLMVVFSNVRFQHDPHSAELKPPTANEPPMFGKPGSEEKFVKPMCGEGVGGKRGGVR